MNEEIEKQIKEKASELYRLQEQMSISEGYFENILSWAVMVGKIEGIKESFRNIEKVKNI